MKIMYFFNNLGKSIPLTGQTGEIRPVLGQWDALTPKY